MTTMDLLTSADVNELLDFLSEYAEYDSKFDNAVQVRFGTPDFENEIDKITGMIDSSLAKDGGDYRRGSWGHICIDTSEISTEICARAEQGNIRLAFTEAEVLYRKLLELFDYQEECEISDEADYCIDQMAKVAEKATSVDDKTYIFEHCLELCKFDTAKNYGENYEARFLKIALRFITPENSVKFEAELSKHECGWRSDDSKIIRLDMIRRLDGASVAR
ncbi:MAG: hypothetical protein LBJ91_04650 [Clostridiales Family XIII bacterium]|jgi:hypothetical protein|nr:hypothetical protein [Clostridiales Family XIII bacterium]